MMKGLPAYFVLLALAASVMLHCTVAHAQIYERQRDSLERAERQLDTLRRSPPSLGTNLFYWGSGTPNAHFQLPVGDHITLGVTGGLKPWPRWAPWDWDDKVNSKWRHFAVVPNFRFWPKANYSGFWVGADMLWTHYNVGGVTFPMGLYPEVQQNRLQGDFIGLGISLGYSWWLTKHLRLEAEIGAAAGYNSAERYECAWCGANLIENTQATLEGAGSLNGSHLHQHAPDPGNTIDSHTTGLFTARLPMKIQQGIDQDFEVKLYMANCATALVIDNTDAPAINGLAAYTTGFADSFNIADSSTTRSVAMRQNINYGTAMLKSTVGYTTVNLQDNNHATDR